MVDGLFGRLKMGAQSLYGSLFLYFGLDWIGMCVLFRRGIRYHSLPWSVD